LFFLNLLPVLYELILNQIISSGNAEITNSIHFNRITRTMNFFGFCGEYSLVLVVIGFQFVAIYIHYYEMFPFYSHQQFSSYFSYLAFTFIFHLFPSIFLNSHMLVNFILVMFMNAGSTKDNITSYSLPENVVKQLSSLNIELNEHERIKRILKTVNIRYCDQCYLIKPLRSHHCSTCGQCTLRMDHHCPFTASCIGINNYKYFYLFLFYAMLGTFYAFLLTLYPYKLCEFENTQNNRCTFVESYRLYFMLAIFSAIVLLLLFAFMSILLLSARSTLDVLTQKKENTVNIEYSWKNVEKEFGPSTSWWLWLVPNIWVLFADKRNLNKQE